MKPSPAASLEERTARLTILVDPRKKAIFERLCAEEDVTPSQMIRRLMRTYIEGRLGKSWTPGGKVTRAVASTRGIPRRRRSTR